MAEENTNTMTVLGEHINPSSDDSQDTNSQNLTDKLDNDDVDYIADLVGEGKKYTTIEEAAKGLAKKAAHADRFIETLKSENKSKEEQLAAAKKVEDILSILKQQDETVVDNSVMDTSTDNTPVDIGEAIKKALAEKEVTDNKQTELNKIKVNQEKAWALLDKEFGSNSKKLIADYINSDPGRMKIINQLGSYQPEELVKFIKSQKDSISTLSTNSTELVISEFDTPGNTLTWGKARKVKKENPTLYRSHKFQNALHQAAANNKNFYKNN